MLTPTGDKHVLDYHVVHVDLLSRVVLHIN